MPGYTLSFGLALGTSKTGLLSVLAAQFVAHDGVNPPTAVGSPITTGFYEHGFGNYSWTGTVPSRTFRGAVEFSASGQLLAVAVINPEEVDLQQGSGSVLVDHNYGGPDALTYETVDGTIKVNDASIDVYLTSDYAAGRTAGGYVVAHSFTDVNGHWVVPVMLDPGAYTVIFYKQGAYGPDRKDVTVTT